MEKASSWRDLPSSLLGGGRSRLIRIAAFACLCLVLTFLYSSVSRASSGAGTFGGRHKTYTGPTSKAGVARPSSAERRLMDAAGNATLGFGSIQFINLPLRFDRLDAATLQAWLSGIDMTEVRGVLADEINDVGMPPEHLTRVKKGEKGCWRAHANIWSQMLRDKTPAVLVLESDAAWDVEVRDIMRNLNQHFTYLLDALQSKTLRNPSFRDRGESGGHPLALSPNDPWHSTHWDLLSLGQCSEDPAHKDEALRYPDEHVAPGSDYWGAELGAERVVRRSGGPVCTTAYAVSQTGAAKLLLRTAVDLDNPVDLVMRRMTMSGDLVAYSVAPTVFGQWEYVDGIGMHERGANSDIHGGNSDGERNMTGWDEVKRTGSIWRSRQDHANVVSFKDMALQRAWGLILGESPLEASQFSEAAGN
ncbi:Glycosyl transferase, family 25 [Cordyceps fumosorosea ARSEF 2679]|uniref:Glycosyl transferase, family 25 n=1 Tax=Cordyceps fumosorosea (strain ARSEF 2679) TaxID=1081104 RepID=A0A162JUF1_CORFA|nr:Glycosyl transferase, family 25 [Cordyceps fumosorosea ARSEF 2679]OAA73942.1 Glycosyl transferase, family 25 [Cordyceps fumosorosea ARSEF 2679]